MRPPDSWKKAPLTAGLALVTIAAWLIAALFQLEQRAIEAFAFLPATELRVGAGPALAAAADRDPRPFGLPAPVLQHARAGLLRPAGGDRARHAGHGDPLSARRLCRGGRAISRRSRRSPMIGASGAISAVLGAYAMLFGRNKVKVASPALALWLNALWLMAAWVVLQICIGIALSGAAFLTGGEGVAIAVAAHIGGFRRSGCCSPTRCCCSNIARPEELRPSARFRLRLEQAVEVDDDIFHLGVVDACAAPCRARRRARSHNRDRGRPCRSWRDRSRGRADP